jgi:hypothetical protein
MTTIIIICGPYTSHVTTVIAAIPLPSHSDESAHHRVT